MPKVAITGSTGFLGSELVRHFLDQDYEVIGLTRNPRTTKIKGLTYKSYDIGKKLRDDTLKGVDLVIHTAYVKYDNKNPDALDVNIRGAEELLRVSRGQKVKRNIFISTMSAHEQAESVYGKQKLSIERLFSTNKDAVIRSGLIIGNGGIVREMASFMTTKRAVPLIGGGRQPLQTIGVYDLARVIEAIYIQKQSGSFTIATPNVYTYKQFYELLGKRLGVKFLFIPIPLSLLYWIVKIASATRLPVGISTDNVLGLKKLTVMNTEDDLARLKIKIDDLSTVLQKTEISAK